MHNLTASEHERYTRDGFVFPLDVFDKVTASDVRAQFEAAERLAKSDSEKKLAFKRAPHQVVPFIYDIACSNKITDRVASILGEDILLYSCGLFVKEPMTSDFVSWHQDLHYWGLEDAEEVTAWLALSASTSQSGCVKFMPGSHKSTVQHRDTENPSNMLSRGQEIAVDVDETVAVEVVLQPGQMSLHHGLVFHGSNANSSSDRRIGIAFRYISTRTRQEGGLKTLAMVVRGEDRHKYFEVAPPPSDLFAVVDVDRAVSGIRQKNELRMRKNA